MFKVSLFVDWSKYPEHVNTNGSNIQEYFYGSVLWVNLEEIQ